MRLYRFVVEVLDDEPDCTDEEFAAEFEDALEAYFEAVDVSVDLVSAEEYDDMAEA